MITLDEIMEQFETRERREGNNNKKNQTNK